MKSTYLVKILAAFTGGIVLALGSALLYLHVTGSELRGTPESAISNASPPPIADAARPPANLPDTGSSTAEKSTADQSSLEKTAEPKPKTAPVTPSRPVSHTRPSQAVVNSVQKRNADLEIARNNRAELEAPPKPVVPKPSEVTPAPNSPSGAVGNPPAQPAPAPVQTAPTPTPTVPAVTPALPTTTPASPNPSPAPLRREPRTVTLAQGTPLIVRMGETVSTDRNYSGDTFRATLDQPIIIGSAIIADRGSKVLGRVVTAQKAGHVQGVSSLNLVLTEINTTDGQRVQVQSTSFARQGETSRRTDAAKVGGGAALGAIIGGLSGGGKGAGIGAGVGGAAGAGDVLLTRGKPAVIQSEARLAFNLASPVTITEKLNY